MRIALAASFLVVACSSAGESATSNDDLKTIAEDGVTTVVGDDGSLTVTTGNRTIMVSSDAKNSIMDVKTTLKGADLEAVKQFVSAPDLSFWKAIKRPERIVVEPEKLDLEAGAKPFFAKIARDGTTNTLRAFWAIKTSGFLAGVSGVNFDLADHFASTDSGFDLTLSNVEPVKTTFPAETVAAVNQFTYALNVTKTADGLDVHIHEEVHQPHGGLPTDELLGCASGAADLLAATFTH